MSVRGHSARSKSDSHKRTEVEANFLALIRDELLSPASIKAEIRRIEAMLKEQERQERAAMYETPANAEFRNVGTKIAALRKLNLGAAAEQAAIRALEVEREDLAARAAKKQSPGLREARQMLAQLPNIAATFDKRLEATLTGGKATRDEMRVISDATRHLIKGGSIRMRPANKTMTGRVELLGLGEMALRVAGTTRRPRIGGSGGGISSLYADTPRVNQPEREAREGCRFSSLTCRVSSHLARTQTRVLVNPEDPRLIVISQRFSPNATHSAT